MTGAERCVHTPVHSHLTHGDSTPVRGHCLLAAAEIQRVLPVVPDPVLVWEVAVWEAGGSVVLDFCLDIFSRGIDSVRLPRSSVSSM